MSVDTQTAVRARTGGDLSPEQREYAEALLKHIEPYRQRVFASDFVQGAVAGTLPLPVVRAWMAQQFAYVQLFPTMFGLLLPKVDDRADRAVLSENISEELEHPGMWLRFCRGFGLSEEQVRGTELCPEMQALNDFLVVVCTAGSAAEGMAALGVGLEGLTSELIERFKPAMARHYHGRDGVDLSDANISWVLEHEGADPRHSNAALGVVARHATTPELRARAKAAAARAIEFFQLGFDGCCRRYAG